MGIPSWYEQGIYKIGEAVSDHNLDKRRSAFQTSHVERVDVYALWDIGDISRKADNHLHRIFKRYKYGHGGKEFFKGLPLEELHEEIIDTFGEDSVKRLL